MPKLWVSMARVQAAILLPVLAATTVAGFYGFGWIGAIATVTGSMPTIWVIAFVRKLEEE